MENKFDESRVQQILELNKIHNSPVENNQQPVDNKSFDDKRVQEAMNVLRGTSKPEEKQKENSEFSWPRFIGEKFTKGVLNLADIPQALNESRGTNPRPEYGDIGIEDAIGEDPYKSKNNKPIISSTVNSLANKAGVDLHSQGEGNTPTQRIVGKGVEFAGSSLIPGGGAAGLARNVALGSAIGAETGALEEARVPEPVAGLASLATVLAGAPALKNAINKALSRTPNLSDAEKKVANYLQQVLEEDGVSAVNKNIAEQPNYSMTGYEPTTAEVSNNPFISTLHRLRQGIPGTGLQKIAGEQNEALHRVSDKLSKEAITTPELVDTIKTESIARKAKRRETVDPLYEEVRKDSSQVDPSNVRAFFEDNKIVKGDKRKDLDMVEKLIKPSTKLTAEEEVTLSNYESKVESIRKGEFKGMSEAAKEKAIEQLEKPKTNNPTVADLDEARQNINDKMRKLKKSGQDNRWRQLKEARDALDKDLAPFPKQAEVTAKYAELSKPVNEILQHPTLKNIPEGRLNDIFNGVYNNKSLDNVKALKQVLKNRPKDWKGFQDATVDHMMNSIKNAGAEGNRNVLSYHKLEKFIEKHKKSLEEVFTQDQMKFLGELKAALKGRNVAETSGIEKQSATYGKLITGTHLTEGFGSKVLKGTTYIPHALPIPRVGKAAGEALRTMLNRYLKGREADVMEVLDNFLKNPEYASKLLNHKFKTQVEFNKQIKEFSKKAVPIVSTSNDKEKEKN